MRNLLESQSDQNQNKSSEIEYYKNREKELELYKSDLSSEIDNLNKLISSLRKEIEEYRVRKFIMIRGPISGVLEQLQKRAIAYFKGTSDPEILSPILF